MGDWRLGARADVRARRAPRMQRVLWHGPAGHERTGGVGLNAAHDAAACLVIDGQAASAIAEERLSWVKHHEGFPKAAIHDCLRGGGLESIDEVDLIVINEYPQTDHELELRAGGYPGRIIATPGHHLLHAYCAWATSESHDTANPRP